MTAPIVVKDLRKDYGGVQVLRGITFQSGAGEILGIIGPNGAGKTTMLHAMMGVIEPTSGEISVLGYSPWRDRSRLCRRINFSSAYAQLPPNVTVERNLRIFAELYGLPRPAAKIGELLSFFGLSHLSRSPTGALSSGEQARLSLCKGLLNDPEVLFLDEPTASLDPETAHGIRVHLKRLRTDRGMGILFASHNMAEVRALCDRVLFLRQGRAVLEGTPEDILPRLQEDSLKL